MTRPKTVAVPPAVQPPLRDIKSLRRDDLERLFKEWGEPKFRVDQLLDWLYARRISSWEAMTNLPQSLRTRLALEFTLHTPLLVTRQGAPDQTQKFLWRLADNALIESVLIPANPALYGEPSDRHTLCVSTQVGCAYGCKFCASGLAGWKRNLEPNEIVEQVLATERWHTAENLKSEISNLKPQIANSTSSSPPFPPAERLVSNLVIMGMGEPLANYASLMRALCLLNASWGVGIGARKITVSTSGLAPQIRQLADEPWQFRLAVSLHGVTDAVRSSLMPINRKYPLGDLLDACDYYVRKKGRMISLEYVLIAGVNDHLDHSRRLADLARRLHARVNLIPYNPVTGLSWERPTEAVQEAFLNILKAGKITATLRREKGLDIDAACGQLRLRTEQEVLPGPENPAPEKFS